MVLNELALYDSPMLNCEIEEKMRNKKIPVYGANLSRCLNELRELKLVLKNTESEHKPTYTVNFTKLENYVRTIRAININQNEFFTGIEESQKAFTLGSVEDNIKLVLREAELRNIRQLKAQIKLYNSSNSSLDDAMMLILLSSPFFRLAENWLLEQSRDENMRKIMLKRLDCILKEIIIGKTETDSKAHGGKNQHIT